MTNSFVTKRQEMREAKEVTEFWAVISPDSGAIKFCDNLKEAEELAEDCAIADIGFRFFIVSGSGAFWLGKTSADRTYPAYKPAPTQDKTPTKET